MDIIIMTYKHSICFSGSGFHYPWQIGVALYLQEHYDLSECCFLGTSGGSYVAAILAVELSVREYIRTVVKESYAVFNQHFLGLYLIYHRVLKGIHLHSLPKEIFNKANGILVISITPCRSFLKNRIINRFISNEDLFDAICTSSQIPFMLSPSFFYKFRGERCLDGGLTYKWLRIDDDTIMISPYQWSKMRYFYALTGVLCSSEHNYYRLVQRGYDDAKANDAYFCKLSKKS